MNARSKKLRADLRRSEIVAAAQRAIRAGGGMREIAEACGLSPGNLYYYFRDKDELVSYCHAQTLEALEAVVEAARAQKDAAARLSALIRGHLGVILDEATGGALHLELPPRDRRLRLRRDRYERAVRALIADGQRRGEIRPGDPKLLAFTLLGALNWSARWYRPGGGASIDDVAAEMTSTLLGGLLS